MMLEPASQVDESNYARLGNRLVGESYASRMARVRRQAGTSEPTLMAGSALDVGTYDFSSTKQIVGPIYGLMAGAAAGAIVGIIGNRLGMDANRSTGTAIVLGSTVALLAPQAYGATYQNEMKFPGRALTSGVLAVGLAGLITSQTEGSLADFRPFKDRWTVLKTAGLAIGGALAVIAVGWGTVASKKGSFSNAMFTAAPLGLAAGVVGGFAHGAVRNSEISHAVSDSLDRIDPRSWK